MRRRYLIQVGILAALLVLAYLIGQDPLATTGLFLGFAYLYLGLHAVVRIEIHADRLDRLEQRVDDTDAVHDRCFADTYTQIGALNRYVFPRVPGPRKGPQG